ncbi:hypothetical protein [Paenibacillus alvei]|uniref:Uncharacterized protein n=1 Tax=Paenibacillus alvei TaxID=44250 RepID=A0AAP6ZUA9_PAEAL|nr:hypothetical protein [Paenibacillus alvei]NOJ69926.1 hypothetical protein [Paenibacillus alvei]
MKRVLQLKWITTAIFFILAAVTAGLFFGLSEADSRGFSWWLSLGSLMLAGLICYLFCMNVLFHLSKHKDEVPLNLSIMAIAFMYNIAVLIHIVLFWLVMDVPEKMYMWIHIITFAAAFILALLIGLTRVSVGRLQREESYRVQAMKRLLLVVQGARLELEGWKDAERDGLVELMRKLEEQVKYSDPMSVPAMVLEEGQLMEQADRLEAGVQSVVRERNTVYSADELRDMIRKLSNGIKLRNEQLANLK